MIAFDICADLPTGVTVLEASAGTGKTYALGALVTRYLAEGVATLDQILVVTFGRAASQELRERVRDRLVETERALAAPTGNTSHPDPLIRLLTDGDPATVARRRRRLAVALADFDAATIATTHQFCQQVLAGLGVAGDSEPGAQLVESLDDLLVEVVDDLYLRGYGAPGAGTPEFSRTEALKLARAAVGDPQARLEPSSDGTGPAPAPARRQRFATAVRAGLDERKRRRNLLGYDDLLSRLADTLAGPDTAARDRMRDRWTIVLVDEFQDTDPVQWRVLELAFAGAAVLVLIGDPKQAIYAFRGGDVVTYLAAAHTAEHRYTLDRNHRTDQGLVDGLEVLFAGAELGDPEIVVRPVTAAYAGSRLSGMPVADPFRLRVVRRDHVHTGPGSKIGMAAVRRYVAADLTADIAAVLGSGATFAGEPVRAGHLAVLVSTHSQATLLRDALADADIPAVIAGSGSVFATEAGQDWLLLLEAVEQPHRPGRVRAAALTPFWGWTAAELAAGGVELDELLGRRARDWADLLATRGVAALVELATAGDPDRPDPAGLAERVLARPDGERRLTDLRHVGQELHAAAAAEGLGAAALVEWLRRRQSEALGDTSPERIRRLDSDAAAVQVVTLHSSKGLQYPIVYLPFAFDRWVPTPDLLQLHDPDGERILDVGGSGSAGWADRLRSAGSEQAGEALRLLYVGLTRAQSQVVAWWAPATNTPPSGLHRILFGRSPGSTAIPESAPLTSDDRAAKILAALQERGGPVIEPAVPAPAARPGRSLPTTADFRVGIFDRELDERWRRLSYSSLTATEYLPPSGAAEPEVAPLADEVLATRPDERLPAVPGGSVMSPMASMPTGATFGTVVHAVLEHTDPQADDLFAELLARCTEQLDRYPVPVDAAALADALATVLASPLGPAAADLTLQQIPTGDRLTELNFEMPVVGGDHPTGDLTLADLAPLLRRHLATDDPLAGYPDRLESPELAERSLRGYLNGSLDAVFRLPGPRYLIADYKTNWLGPAGPAELSALDYHPDRLQQAMSGSDYPLQALLYSVVLHRFLRWRQPGYRPEQHLAGVLYLYVRGMCGPDTPVIDGRPCGVFAWTPPPDLVAELSDLLDRGRA